MADTVKYLQDLRDKTEYIDIRGLHVGKGQAHRLAIEELYISLTTTNTAPRTATTGHRAGAAVRKGRKMETVHGELDSCRAARSRCTRP